jgi:hypothetical protein
MTDERAAAVLRVLEADLPPSSVDIDRAVSAGRRRERTRRVLAAGALAGVTALAGIGVVAVLGGNDPAAPPLKENSAAGPTGDPAACVASRLPAPTDWRTAHPGRISPNGRFIVGETGDPALPLLWTDGALTTPAVPAGVTAKPHDVNDAGVIVGLARRNERTLPFVIRDGAYTELALPSGAEGAAHAINARGDIVGEAMFANGDSKVLVWKAAGGAPTTLPSTTKWAGAHAITDDGTVFGTLDDGGTPYVWGPDGTGRALPAPEGSAKGKAMGAAGDYVYGHAGSLPVQGDPTGDKKEREANGGEPRWVRWQVSTGAVVEVKGLFPNAVDSTGTVVGSLRKGASPNITSGPARWRDGKVVEIPGPDGAPGTGEVGDTSVDGTRLVGWTGDVNAPVPTVWRC